MRFLRPEHYDKSTKSWSKHVENRYLDHVNKFWAFMPNSVREFAQDQFRQAEILGIKQIFHTCPAWGSSAVLSVVRDNHVAILLYNLWDSIRDEAPPHDWKWTENPSIWLADEFDHYGQNCFVHRILVSDGKTVEFPFYSLNRIYIPLEFNSEAEEQVEQKPDIDYVFDSCCTDPPFNVPGVPIPTPLNPAD